MDKRGLEYHLAAADFCQLLAISLRLPNQALAEGVEDGSFLADFSDVLAELACAQAALTEGRGYFKQYEQAENCANFIFTDLRREYTRLFHLPEPVPVALTQTDFGSALVAAQAEDCRLAALLEQFYRRQGLVLQHTLYEPADAMTTELEFLMYLYIQKAVAMRDENQQKARELQTVLEQFKTDYFSGWSMAFFSKLQQSSGHDFYRGVAAWAQVGLQMI